MCIYFFSLVQEQIVYKHLEMGDGRTKLTEPLESENNFEYYIYARIRDDLNE